MKMIAKLILFFAILILPFQVQSKSLTSDTDTIPNSRSFSFDILPEINRDLKICDLVKQNNILLQSKIDILKYDLTREKTEKQEAQKQARKEKRKRIFWGVTRTVLEVGVLVTIIIL